MTYILFGATVSSLLYFSLILFCEVTMNTIQKTSRCVLTLINFLLTALPLCFITGWLFIDAQFMKPFVDRFLNSPIHTPEGDIYFSQVHWTFAAKWLGVLAGLFSFAPVFLSLWCLKKIFTRYAAGDIFHIEAAQNYTYLGWLFFIDALLIKPITDCLYLAMATIANEPGHRYLALSFGTANLKMLFYGMLIIVISWVILEATKLKDEEKLTI